VRALAMLSSQQKRKPGFGRVYWIPSPQVAGLLAEDFPKKRREKILFGG